MSSLLSVPSRNLRCVDGRGLAGPAGERMRQRIPQRRFGATSDLDGALLLLASDAFCYMTGSIIVVDGGFLSA